MAPNEAQYEPEPRTPSEEVDMLPPEENEEPSKAMPQFMGGAFQPRYYIDMTDGDMSKPIRVFCTRYNLIVEASGEHEDIDSIRSSMVPSSLAIVEKHIIQTAQCVACREMIKWHDLSQHAQRVVHNAVTDALAMQAEWCTFSRRYEDPGRVVCKECASWKQNERPQVYLDRLQRGGALEIHGDLSMSVSGPAIGYVHDRYSFDPIRTP